MTLKYEITRTERTIQYRMHYARHRLDGPAMIWMSGTLLWMQYDQLHRDNGPAQICRSPRVEIYVKRGVEYVPEIRSNKNKQPNNI